MKNYIFNFDEEVKKYNEIFTEIFSLLYDNMHRTSADAFITLIKDKCDELFSIIECCKYYYKNCEDDENKKRKIMLEKMKSSFKLLTYILSSQYQIFINQVVE